MSDVLWGNLDSAVRDVKETLLALLPNEHFVVFGDYRLYPSIQPSLPKWPLGFTLELGGEWVAYDADGQVESRFADWPDEETT